MMQIFFSWSLVYMSAHVTYGEALRIRPDTRGGYLTVCGWNGMYPNPAWGCGPNITVQQGTGHLWVIEGKSEGTVVRYGDTVKIRIDLPTQQQNKLGWEKGSVYLSPCWWANNEVSGTCHYNVSLRSDKGYYAWSHLGSDFVKSLRLWSIQGGPSGKPVSKDTPVYIRSLYAPKKTGGYPGDLTTCGTTSDSCGKNVTITRGVNTQRSKKWVFETPDNEGVGGASWIFNTPKVSGEDTSTIPSTVSSGSGVESTGVISKTKIWIIAAVVIVFLSLGSGMMMMMMMMR